MKGVKHVDGIAYVHRIRCGHGGCFYHEIDDLELRAGRSRIRLFGPFATADEFNGVETNSAVDGSQLVSMTRDGRWLTFVDTQFNTNLVDLKTGWGESLGTAWPLFSPDGRFLLAYSRASQGNSFPVLPSAPQLDSSGSEQTRILNLTNGKWSSLGRGGAMPAWSERGDKLTWQVHSGTFATASALHPTKVTLVPAGPCDAGQNPYANPAIDNSGTAPYPAWAPDGRSLLCFAATSTSKDGYISYWKLENLSLRGGRPLTVARGFSVFEPADNQLSPPPPFPLPIGNTIVATVGGGDSVGYVEGKGFGYLPGSPYDFEFTNRHKPALVAWYDSKPQHGVYVFAFHVGTWTASKDSFKAFATGYRAFWVNGWTPGRVRRPHWERAYRSS